MGAALATAFLLVGQPRLAAAADASPFRFSRSLGNARSTAVDRPDTDT